MHYAANIASPEVSAAVVEILLVAAGADTNAAGRSRMRPLHLVVACLDTALLLVRLGASLSLCDAAGRTALKVAARGGSGRPASGFDQWAALRWLRCRWGAPEALHSLPECQLLQVGGLLRLLCSAPALA